MVAALETLLQDWRERLRAWSADGSLASAARHALELEGEQPLLDELVSQWAAGDFSALPPISLLPASSMPGAAGAYAISTGTIYLNQDWVETAGDERVFAVLTEELGHHLDDLLNQYDTAGDEGSGFQSYLLTTLESEPSGADDGFVIPVNSHQKISAELSPVTLQHQSSLVTQTRPGISSGEYQNRLAFAAIKRDGSVIAWGDKTSGGSIEAIKNELNGGVKEIYSNFYSFAALKEDGSVVTWGNYPFPDPQGQYRNIGGG